MRAAGNSRLSVLGSQLSRLQNSPQRHREHRGTQRTALWRSRRPPFRTRAMPAWVDHADRSLRFKGLRFCAPEPGRTQSVSGRIEAADKSMFLEIVSLSAVCGRSPQAGRGPAGTLKSASVAPCSEYSVSLWFLFFGVMQKANSSDVPMARRQAGGG